VGGRVEPNITGQDRDLDPVGVGSCLPGRDDPGLYDHLVRARDRAQERVAYRSHGTTMSPGLPICSRTSAQVGCTSSSACQVEYAFNTPAHVIVLRTTSADGAAVSVSGSVSSRTSLYRDTCSDSRSPPAAYIVSI